MYGMSGVIAFVSEFLCISDSDSLYALNELPISQTLRMLFPHLDHTRPLYLAGEVAHPPPQIETTMGHEEESLTQHNALRLLVVRDHFATQLGRDSRIFLPVTETTRVHLSHSRVENLDGTVDSQVLSKR